MILKRGTKGKTSKSVFYADAEYLLIQYDDYNQYIQLSPDTCRFTAGTNKYLQFTGNGCVLYDKNKIEFGTNGYMRASIEPNGDAKFGNIYSNGTLVTSDRKKKTGVKKLSGSFLEKVKGSPVYRYRLKQEAISAENTGEKKAKHKSLISNSESVGLIYDEAPKEIRREDVYKRQGLHLYTVGYLLKGVYGLCKPLLL